MQLVAHLTHDPTRGRDGQFLPVYLSSGLRTNFFISEAVSIQFALVSNDMAARALSETFQLSRSLGGHISCLGSR